VAVLVDLFEALLVHVRMGVRVTVVGVLVLVLHVLVVMVAVRMCVRLAVVLVLVLVRVRCVVRMLVGHAAPSIAGRVAAPVGRVRGTCSQVLDAAQSDVEQRRHVRVASMSAGLARGRGSRSAARPG